MEKQLDSLVRLRMMGLVEDHERDVLHSDEAVGERVEEKLSGEDEAAVGESAS